MFYKFWWIILILIIVFVFLFSKIRLITKFCEDAKEIKLKIFGITVFDSSKPKKKKKEKPSKKKEDKTKKASKKESKSKFDISQLDNYLEFLKAIFTELSKISKFVKRKIKCPLFNLHVTFGMKDAAKVGITNGIIWSVIGFCYPIVYGIVDIKKPQIQVTPVFNQECLNISYEGIYDFKMYNIIYVALRSFKIILKILKLIKGGAKHGGTSN